jgi:hypothetical protein
MSTKIPDVMGTRSGSSIPDVMAGRKKIPAGSFNRVAFPTLSNATPTLMGQPFTPKPRDVTRKGLSGKVSEFVVPTRGFTDKEVAEARPTLKDTAVGAGKFGAEIAGGVLTIADKLGGFLREKMQPGYKAPDRNPMVDSIVGYAQPKTTGEALAMRALDIGTLGVGGLLKSPASTARVLSKISSVPRVEKELKALGLFDAPLAGRIAKETDPNKILKLINEGQKTAAKDVATLRTMGAPAVRPSAVTPQTVPIRPSSVDGIERRFTKRAQAIMPEATISSRYAKPRNTETLAVSAKNLYQSDPEQVRRIVMGNRVDDKVVAMASELLKNLNKQAQSAPTKIARDIIYENAAEVAVVTARKLTEAGRTVQAATILTMQTPEGLARFAAREIQKYNEGVRFGKIPELTGAQAKQIADEMKAIQAMPESLMKHERLWKLQDTIKSWVPTGVMDKVVAVWRAGLLTGLKTTGLNIGSNLAHGVTEALKQVPATGFDRVASVITGRRTTTATMRGAIAGAREGMIKGKKYFFSGFDERNIGAKLDYTKVNFKTKFFQGYTDFVFRWMGASDQPFYYAAYSRSMFDQALAQGMNKGHKGKALKEYAEALVANPTADMQKYGVADATTAVFLNDTHLGDFAKGLQNSRFAGVPVGRVVIPFAQTPSAVAMQMIHYSPLGFLQPVGRVFSALRTKAKLKSGKITLDDIAELERQGEKMFDQRLWAQEMGRATVGTAFTAAGAYLLGEGLISLNTPDTTKERELWKLEGRKPNSILVQFPWESEGKWRSPMVLGPAGMVMLAGAHLQNAIEQEGSPTEAAELALGGVWASFMEQTFLVGVNDAIGALQEPTKNAGRYFEKLIASLVPTLVSDVARATDPQERVTQGLQQTVQARLPGARRDLYAQHDVLGRKRESVGNPLEILADPSRPSPVLKDPVVLELRRLTDAGYNVSPSPISERRHGYASLTQEENLTMRRMHGRLIDAHLQKLIQMPEFQHANDEDKAKVITRLNKEANYIARAFIVQKILTETPPEELRDRLAEMVDEKVITRDIAKILNQ